MTKEATAIAAITLARIDTENLEEVEDIPEAVRFAIVLSDTPSIQWLQEFSYAYSVMHHPIKPPVEIVEDRLWISFLPRYALDLPPYLDFVRSVVRRATDEEQRTATYKEHDDTRISRFREVLKGVRISEPQESVWDGKPHNRG